MQSIGYRVKMVHKNLLAASLDVGQRSSGNSSLTGKAGLSVSSLLAETPDVSSNFLVDTLWLHTFYITIILSQVNMANCLLKKLSYFFRYYY